MPSDLRLFGGGLDAVVGDAVEKAGLSGPAADEIFYLGNEWNKDVLSSRASGFSAGQFVSDVRGCGWAGCGSARLVNPPGP